MTEAERICAGVAEPYRARALELAENMLFIERKLQETREAAEPMPIAITYDNGGGQKGIRKNPVFDAYGHLLKSYTSALRELREIVKPTGQAKTSLVKFETFAKTMRKTADA